MPKPRRDKRVKILSHRTPYRGHFKLEVYRLKHKLYRGGWSQHFQREIFERGDAVGILLYDPKRDAIVMVEQFRLAAYLASYNPWQLEVPAGIIDRKSESPADVAKREALEETGIAIAGRPKRAFRVMTTPGGSTETYELFVANVDSNQAKGLHGLAAENEDIKVVVKRVPALMRMLKAGRIPNGPSALALYWFAVHRAKFRR